MTTPLAGNGRPNLTAITTSEPKTLEQRVEEIRGLVSLPGLEKMDDLSSPEALVELSHTLADALEASQRKVIESHIQLISLREVAHNLLSIQAPDRAAETIAMYIHKAFDYERVAVLLLERDRRYLSGRVVAAKNAKSTPANPSADAAAAATGANGATSGTAAGLVNEPLELDLVKDGGVLVDTFLHGESRLVERPAHTLFHTGGLGEAFDTRRLNSCLVVPLRSGKAPGSCHTDKACRNAPCPMHGRQDEDPCWLSPIVDCRHEARFGQEPRRATCLSCSVFPMLGVILVGRTAPAPDLTSADLMLLDSVGGTMATIVENARLYAELRQEELFRNDILNSMGTGLVAVDLEGRTISLNQTAVRMTGFKPEETMGLVPPFFQAGDTGLASALRGSLQGTPVIRREARLLHRNGTAFPASVSTAPLRSADGKVYGVIATFLDLTDFKKMEERVAQLDRLAVLGRFTAAIAHEIRNPLTGISTGVQYLTRGMSADDAQNDNVHFILDEIQRLNRIVEDLFRVTHPQPPMTTLENLGRLVDRALQSLGTLAADQELEIEKDYEPGLPPVPVDADQLQQVAINLIKNAVEATPPGGRVRIVTKQRPGRRGEAGWAVLQVIDNGAGMNAETRKKIFEPFFTGKKQGTGLGLYITHGIVERHGGHMRVESREGAGSTFTIELPLSPISNGGNS